MPKRDRAAEFYYLDDKLIRKDADLHNPILDDGDHQAAIEVSKVVMRKQGFTEEQIALLFKDK